MPNKIGANSKIVRQENFCLKKSHIKGDVVLQVHDVVVFNEVYSIDESNIYVRCHKEAKGDIIPTKEIGQKGVA